MATGIPSYDNFNRIEHGLYLGNLTAAEDVNVLLGNNISHVLTVASDPLPAKITSLNGINNYFIKVDDMPQSDLLSYFTMAADFIEDGQKNGNVLVHCLFGVSRSATLVACFLMRKYKINVDDALSRIKTARPSIGPNNGFISQLLLYYTMDCTVQKSNLLYKLYKIQGQNSSNTRYNISKIEEVIQEIKDILQEDKNENIDSEVAYKCKSCRSSLIHKNELIPHESGKSPNWTNKDLLKLLSSHNQCNKGIFTLPLEWMKESSPNVEGKILCFKCRAKIGSFNWVKGCVCPCGSKLQPGYYIVPSKVDEC